LKKKQSFDRLRMGGNRGWDGEDAIEVDLEDYH
jgi:hypothetical protein